MHTTDILHLPCSPLTLNQQCTSLTLYINNAHYSHFTLTMHTTHILHPQCTPLTFYTHHSVEIPSMVVTQWNILYWRSKLIFHTVCRCAVGCEWGTTSVYFGITYVCLIPNRLAVGPQYQHLFFFVKSTIWGTHTKSLKNPCRFKAWIVFLGQILIE